MEWYLLIFRKYADYKTRSTRKEYWMFTLINFLITLGLGIIGAMIYALSDDVDFWFPFALITIFICIILIPGLAITVRRLHDSGKSGWFTLVNFIPTIGSFILVILLCLNSEYGENKWGPNPYGVGNNNDYKETDFDKDK